METKAELIAQTNKDFPKAYPDRKSPPTLTSVTVGDVSHEYGTEADLTARFKKADGVEYELRGAYLHGHHGSDISFTSTNFDAPKTDEEELVSYLFGELFCGDGRNTGPEKWQNLPD